MQTAGNLLRLNRIKTKLTLTQVSRLTKIPLKTLLALEKNQFNQLPSAPYIQGFIQNYAQAVNLDPNKVIAAFKRDFNRLKPKKILPQGLTQPLNPPVNRRFLGAFIIIIILFAYLGMAIYKIFAPPQLTIDRPQSGIEVTAPFLIKGKTDRDATLSLNDKTVNLEPDGNFTTTASEAELKFKAISRRGKSTTVVRYVIIVQ